MGMLYTLVTSSISNGLDTIMPHIIAYVIFIWAIIGFYYLFKYLYTVIHAIYAWLLRPCKNLKKKYGSWAVVTGSTDGIGEAIAFEFARKGLNIVLISRDENKLEATKQKLLSKYSTVQCIVLPVNFSNFIESVRVTVAEKLKDLDIGVLVNNVGVSYPYPMYFHELQDASVDNIISINIDSTTWMTRIVLPGMVQRKRGAIVNMSSAAGVTVSPLLSEYGAAKSFISMFSKALHSELADFNIHVQVQTPLYVATKMAKIRNTSLMVPSATAFARASVACIGYEAVVSPYWSHAVQLWFMSFIPEWSLEALMLKYSHYSIRNAGQKKDAAKRNS